MNPTICDYIKKKWKMSVCKIQMAKRDFYSQLWTETNDKWSDSEWNRMERWWWRRRKNLAIQMIYLNNIIYFIVIFYLNFQILWIIGKKNQKNIIFKLLYHREMIHHYLKREFFFINKIYKLFFLFLLRFQWLCLNTHTHTYIIM